MLEMGLCCDLPAFRMCHAEHYYPVRLPPPSPSMQTKLGARLPPAAASRCLQLACWDAAAGQQDQASDSGRLPPAELLLRLQLSSLDPGPAGGGSASLQAAAGLLAELAAESGRDKQLQQRMQLQLQLPAEVMMVAVAGGGGGQRGQQHFSAWQAAQPAEAAGAGQSLQALLQLLGRVALSEQQQGPLLLAAAAQAAGGGNASCAQRLLLQAEAALSTGSSGSGAVEAAGALLCRLRRLQLPALAEAPQDVGSQPWQLLLAARGSSAAASVVPAAVQLLLSAPGALEAAEVAAGCQTIMLPSGSSGVSGSSAAIITRLEQLLLEAQQQGAAAATPAVQFAVLKAAVAALPDSAHQWWQLAAWLHQWAEQQQESEAAAAAHAAAFTANCTVLALAGAQGSSGSSSRDGYSVLPPLLQTAQLLTQPGSSSWLPSDAEAQLAAVPPATWLPIVPQLLAQLAPGSGGGSNQADPGQRRQALLLQLLLHVAEAEPSQVLLPAMVAAQALQGVHTPELAAGQQPAAPLLRLLQELQQRHPALAHQLQVLAREAARLAVLPEEHWQAVLQEAAATAAKRLQLQHKQRRQEQQQEAPVAAGEDATEGYLAAMAPVLLCLQQQLQAAEAALPETPHERRFHQQQLPRLRRLLQQLLEPLAAAPPTSSAAAAVAAGSPAAPATQQRQAALTLLKAAATEMAAALRPKQLALADVAPALAELADTGIPMPGSAPAASAAAAEGVLAGVMVAGVAAKIAVLSTKTRPKRLRLLGSDGQQHAFLLKVPWAANVAEPCLCLRIARC